MDALTVIFAVFAMLGGIDRIFGNRFGLGSEFEKGFMLLGNMVLAMIGMIVIAPVIANALSPASTWLYNTFKIDPSIIPASLFANDMGGAPLAKEVAQNELLGGFNGLVVSSMMGATVSYSIPYSLGAVKKEQHGSLLLGLLCGFVTLPLGCFAGGLALKMSLSSLLLNLLPLILFSIIIALGLVFAQKLSVKIFGIIGAGLKILITVGLLLGIWRFLTGHEIIKGLGTLESGADICINAAVVLSGAFPLMAFISRLLKKPLSFLSKKLNLNEASIVGLLTTTVSSTPVFGTMDKMDDKGVVLNAAFAVSAGYAIGSHLAFTVAFDAFYLESMLIAKFTGGIFALLTAMLVLKKNSKKA